MFMSIFFSAWSYTLAATVAELVALCAVCFWQALHAQNEVEQELGSTGPYTAQQGPDLVRALHQGPCVITEPRLLRGEVLADEGYVGGFSYGFCEVYGGVVQLPEALPLDMYLARFRSNGSLTLPSAV